MSRQHTYTLDDEVFAMPNRRGAGVDVWRAYEMLDPDQQTLFRALAYPPVATETTRFDVGSSSVDTALSPQLGRLAALFDGDSWDPEESRVPSHVPDDWVDALRSLPPSIESSFDYGWD